VGFVKMNYLKHLLSLPLLILLICAPAAQATEMAGQKACAANLRIIEGAIEMYEIDGKPVTDLLNKDYLQVLLDEGYLKSKLQGCPGAYLLVPGVLWGKKLIDLPGSDTRPEYRLRQNAAGRYEVFCTAHGNFEELKKLEGEYTARYRKTTGFAAIGLMFLLGSGVFVYLKITAGRK
jgi:competence protein ComGC